MKKPSLPQSSRPTGHHSLFNAAGALLITATCALVAVSVLAQLSVSTNRLSQNEGGVGQLGSAGRPSVSANGGVYAFSSTAENLVESDSNNRADVFLGTIGTPGLRRISTGKGGIQANGGSFNPSVSPVSANGFVVVAYASDASNIGRALGRFPDTNNVRDIYFTLPARRNFTKRVTYGVGGIAPNGPSRNPSVTILPEPNRMLVAYQSAASNLIEGDTNDQTDIFLTTISNGEDELDDDDTSNRIASEYTTVRISRPSSTTEQANGASTDPTISGNGRYIVYESTASNLVPGATPSAKQIYLYDISSGVTELISKDSLGLPGDADSFNGSISYNGSFVAYSTLATNLLADGKSVIAGALQVVLYNRVTKRAIRVNVSNESTPGNGIPFNLSNSIVSPNGRLVFFADQSENLVTGDSNGSVDLFVRDIVASATARLSSGFDGTEANGSSASVSLGQSSFTDLRATAAFLSTASNLVPNDVEGNEDVFDATIDLSRPPYVKGTLLEVPPDVTPAPDRATLALQRFTLPKRRITAARSSVSNNIRARAAKPKPVLQYVVSIYRERPDSSRTDTRRKTGTRANVTFRNLPPGTYVSQYRTQVSTGGKITNKSKPSPITRFAVGTPTPTPND